MAELLFSAFLDVLFDRLASRDLFNFVRQIQGGVSSELKNWERKLKMIQAVLSDAEEKQLTDESVKMWLDDLQDLAYDAEDILDEFATQALERKLMVEDPDQPGSSTDSKVRKMVPAACFSCFMPISTIKFNSSMRTKIKDITSRMEDLCKQRIELGLQLTPGAGGTSSATAAQRRPHSSSVQTERAVYGRDDDKAKILAMVLSDEPSVANFRVIPIVGMAGVGKTTLAREVYNDRAVEVFKFDIKAWVCLSDNFDVLGISRALLESITCRPCELKALNDVQIELKKAVNGKKFLLVLDDVWNENYDSWATLKAPFIAGAPNSKIIVTTRNSHVASTMGPIQHYNLKALSNEDCWSVFIMHAFDDRDINAHQISELFRNKVVEKCGGLPLAAAILGGLLRSRRQDAWDELLNRNILANLPQQSDVHPVLRLSYHYLPSYLKRCFAYCAIFPKDYEFTEGELVFLWMAEGIIQQSSKGKELEDWVSECFHDLVSRSIFQPSSSDNSKFVLHDLVHDLAQLVSGEIIFKLEEANKPSRRFERVRHYSYSQGWCDGKNKFDLLYEVQHLRTFLPLNRRFYVGPYYMPAAVLYDLLPKFKNLRVLSLEQYCVIELPHSFADLRLLRCLNLAGTSIKSLPKSTSSLLNLEILILKDCSRLIKLPAKMRKLINLSHLDIEGANLLQEMPWGMKELKNLRKLSNFIVGKGGAASGLKDLKNLKFLRGELCISGLENVHDSQDAREAMLCEKQNLKALSLEWGSQFDNSRDEALEENVLDMLQTQKDLKELAIRHYGGVRFPSWVANPSFSTMEVLTLKNCENCTSLPTLGLLSSLKHLVVNGLKKLKSIGVEFYGESCSNPFQSLVTLCFEDLPEWEHWDTKFDKNGVVAGFSSLCELSIVECPKFSGKLPECLPSLEKLVVSKCGELVVSFSSFPKLCKLQIDGCKGLECSMSPVDDKSVDCMTISNSSFEIYGCKGMMYNDCPAANSVTISNLLEFGKFLKQGFQQVETLWISDSDQIESWLETKKPLPEQGLHVITLSEEVSIEESVISFVSFPEINFFLKNLQSLRIGKARTIKSLPQEIVGNNSHLESLYISNCDSLTFIARSKLSSSLKSLEILDCENLQHLVDGEEDDPSSSSSSGMLKCLKIIRCPELTSLSSGIQLLEALEYLDIDNCPKLGSIPDSLYNLDCLQRIEISDCPSLVSLGERGLPESILIVGICRCEKLEALPNDMHKLNSLRHLSIWDCPSIVSFPEGGFPTNLTSLFIGGDVKVLYKALIQWGLHRLTSLRRLWIIEGCHEAKCFPDEEMGMMLPSSLTHLEFSGLSELRYLSSMAFQSLTSLEHLEIYNCPNLTSFPEVGLPSSLLGLLIAGCPKLKKECKRGKGKEWSKIANIPMVLIDRKFIYDPDSEE
ncbi:putative disease resistance RPP13-like protein 1 [Citrus clementina]|uniref:putative disease resistance RPP13-like protein 1 n=1 Tax=Citrus clementina TaxID=85681 RepID=UPI000CED3F66|nr:putative disease resistance RPP13-like protein 1 [Citrus x clementina]XP_024043856.1 putative disease resistance RPP13-like protein 1 [Citrus x clementina]XP_024043857.1 putative disease resistance RPP13-like protein 1 [Citrus x clementina]XP_024043858.1 putative disease resistance RPP13-like protein 1 [Citrus x clementina]XP_024043859.1 putative disease resistance RPP13-like protein 1 [Citrus x clementina]XP_024043860.1 putative disease resistance RPP13-like protein 1 [Citrus x clementina]